MSDDLTPQDFGGSADRHPFEVLSSAVGETPGEVAALDRVLTGLREVAIARFKANIAVSECAKSMRNFVAAWQASEDRLTHEEARQVAAHPDLAELNVQMDGFYGAEDQQP